MSWLTGKVLGNPQAILWVAVAAFCAGLALGAAPAWYVQGLRLAAVKAEFGAFVSTTKAQGEAAQKATAATIKADKLSKERSDNDYKTSIATLRADAKRLRDARSASSLVPAAPASSSRADLACFDRAELERALQQLDDSVSGLIAEGDTNAIGLNVAKAWAFGVQRGN